MDFAHLKRRDLQSLCKQHSLPASGTNSDLVSRLNSALKKDVEAKPPSRRGEKDVSVPARATRSRGEAVEVDIHSFPVEGRKKSVKGGGDKKDEVKKDGGGGVKEVAVQATRSRGGAVEATVPPVVEKTRSQKEGNTKNDDQVMKAAPSRTTRSRGGTEVADTNQSAPVEKKTKTAKGKGVSTENDGGVKKDISVRTRSRRGTEAVDSHASPPAEKKGKKRGREDSHASPTAENKGKKRGRVSTDEDEEVKNEVSQRTTRSRPGADVAVSNSSPPVEKKSTKRGKVDIKNDDGAKEIPVRTTRSRVGAEIPAVHPPSPAEKNKTKRGNVNTKDDGVKNEIPVRTTRSRIAAVVPFIKSPSPVVKNIVKRGVDSKTKDGVEEVTVRTTRSRLGTETGISPSPVAKKRTRSGEMKTENTKTEKVVQVTKSSSGKKTITKSSSGKKTKGNTVNPEKNDTPPKKKRKVEEEVKKAAVLKKKTSSKKMGDDKKGRKGKITLKLKRKPSKPVKRKGITSHGSVTLDKNKKSPMKKDSGSALKPEKASNQSKGRVEQSPKKSARAGGSNSKHKRLASNLHDVTPGSVKMQTDQSSKKTPVQKSLKTVGKSHPTPEVVPQRSTRSAPRRESNNVDADLSVHKVQGSGKKMQTDQKSRKSLVQKSIKTVGKSYPTPKGLPQRSTRSAPRRESSNVDADLSVHKVQGTDDVPSFVTKNGSTGKADDTAGIVKVVAENISVEEDIPPIGVQVQVGLINSMNEAAQMELEAQNVDDAPNKEFSEILPSVGGTNEIASTCQNSNELDAAAQNVIDIAGENSHPVIISEDFTVQGASGTILGISSGSKNVDDSENDLVKDDALLVQDEAREELDRTGKTSDVTGADVHIETDGGTFVDETSSGQQVTESASGQDEAREELDTIEETSDVAGAEDHIETDGGAFVVQVTESASVQDEARDELDTIEETSDVAGADDHIEKDEARDELDEARDELDEARDELDTIEETSDVAGADDHIETDGGTLVVQVTESASPNIDVAGEINDRVIEFKAQNEGASPTFKGSLAQSNSGINVAEEINELDTYQKNIVEAGAEDHMRMDDSRLDEASTSQPIAESPTQEIDVPSQTDNPVVELKTENEEASLSSEESPIQSTSRTIDVAEENDELDVASTKTIDVAGAGDRMKMDGDMLVDETSTGLEIPEADTATPENIDAAGEISPQVLERMAQIEESSPISEESSPIIEESPNHNTGGTIPDIISGTMGVHESESEKDYIEDHSSYLSDETRHRGHEAQLDGNVDTLKNDHTQLEEFFCDSSTYIVPTPEEVTVPTTVGTSEECMISSEKDVDDNEKVLVVSPRNDISETPLNITGERSVEDTSKLAQADPVMDVGHISTVESPQSYYRSEKNIPIDDSATSDIDVQHKGDASMIFQQPSASSQGRGAIDFDDASAVRLVFDNVGEPSVVKSQKVGQERSAEFREDKCDRDSVKLNMEFGVEPVKEDAPMMVHESELSQGNAELGSAHSDQSPADAELDVGDFGEASIAKSGQVFEETTQTKLTVKAPCEIEAINYSFKLLIDQFCEEHPGECETSAVKTPDLRVSEGTPPELGVEDVGKDSFLKDEEVLEENSDLSKEVNCGSDSDNPSVKVSWDVNNGDPEASVEKFDHNPGDRKEDMSRDVVLDTNRMMDRDFSYDLGRDVWDGENDINDLGIFSVENRESTVVEEINPSEGTSEMFMNFNEVAELQLQARIGAFAAAKDGSNVVEDEIAGTTPVPQVYTQSNVNERNFGSADRFMQNDSWHMQDEFVDLKNYVSSETQSHVEYSESHVDFSHLHQEFIDTKNSGANAVEGRGTEPLHPVGAERHGQTNVGSDFAGVRESSPGPSSG